MSPAESEDELPPLDRRKQIAALFLLPDCDMACRFCASEQDFSVMSFEQATRVLEGLRRQHIRNVVLGGGEPLLWPFDLFRLARLAHELGFLTQVCTNGVNLPGGFAHARGVDRYILPLEAVDASIHDEIRVHPHGHHARVLERLDTLRESGREFTISTVITRRNVAQLPALAELLRDLQAAGARVHAWHLYRFLATGRGGRGRADELALDRAEYLRACDSARDADLGFAVYRRPNMLQSSSVEYFWSEGGCLRVGSEAIRTDVV